MKFDDLLSRADDELLQKLVNPAGVKLINLLDTKLATPTQLRKLLLGLCSRTSLLSKTESRKLLLELLYPSEAEALSSQLGISKHHDVYKPLKRIRIRKSTKYERVLFDFFELKVPSPSNQNDLPALQIQDCSYSLFEHQRVAARKIKRMISSEPRRVLLHMPTGAGKTRTAMNIVADHLRLKEPTTVIWLAYSEELCEQAASEFYNAWQNLGDRKIKIHRFWGNKQLKIDDVKDGVIIASLSKLYNAAKKKLKFIGELGSRCSFVIIDEAHQAIAETYKLVLETLMVFKPDTALLGLSATPGRSWLDMKIDQKLADFFARQKVTLKVKGYDNPIDYLIDQKYLAKTEYKKLFHDSSLNLSDNELHQIKNEFEIPEKLLTRLAENEKRNLKIILEIEKLAKCHMRILVFAATVQHSDLLATVLKARGLNANSITSKTSPIDRKNLIENYKNDDTETKVLCNFGVLTTGFDAPKTSAALIARPTKSLVLYTQMIGRAIRGVKAKGNEKAEIITVVDPELLGFGSIADSFNYWEDVWND